MDVFDGAVFDGPVVFDTGVTVSTFVPIFWGGRVKRLTTEDRKKLVEEERIALGILPPKVQKIAVRVIEAQPDPQDWLDAFMDEMERQDIKRREKYMEAPRQRVLLQRLEARRKRIEEETLLLLM